MEKITVEVIAHKEFSISSKGYNQAEVDNFLDDICEEMERMEKEITELRQKTTAVHPAAVPAPAAGGVTDPDFDPPAVAPRSRGPPRTGKASVV